MYLRNIAHLSQSVHNVRPQHTHHRITYISFPSNNLSINIFCQAKITFLFLVCTWFLGITHQKCRFIFFFFANCNTPNTVVQCLFFHVLTSHWSDYMIMAERFNIFPPIFLCFFSWYAQWINQILKSEKKKRF